MLTPLALFDVRHQFLNTRLFIQFFTSGSERNWAELFSWTEVLANVFLPYLYVRSVWLMAVLYIAFVGIVWYLRKKQTGFLFIFYSSTLWLLVLIPLFFMLYGKRPSEYYFVFLYPFFILTFVDFIIHLKKLVLLPIITISLLLLHIPAFRANLQDNTAGLYYKKQTVSEIKTRMKSSNFKIEFAGRPNTYTGFQYLFDIKNIKLSTDTHAPKVYIHEPPQPGDIAVGLFGIQLPIK
jgi:hypothetical protein